MTQTDTVIETILAGIDLGEIMPGDAVDEKRLMAECDVSRTPVREALIRLETQGLIQRHARKGAVLFRPTVEEFLTILEVHAQLEAHAAELAARRIAGALAEELRTVVAACEAHDHGTVDAAGYYALNLRFHEVVAVAAHNPVLLEMIKTNARKLMAYYRLRYRTPGATGASAREHGVIAGHILAQEENAAREAMLAHFNYDRRTIMDLIASVG